MSFFWGANSEYHHNRQHMATERGQTIDLFTIKSECFPKWSGETNQYASNNWLLPNMNMSASHPQMTFCSQGFAGRHTFQIHMAVHGCSTETSWVPVPSHHSNLAMISIRTMQSSFSYEKKISEKCQMALGSENKRYFACVGFMKPSTQEVKRAVCKTALECK